MLILGNEAATANHIQSILEKQGYAVPGIVSSEAEVLALAEQEAVDLLLIDLGLRSTTRVRTPRQMSSCNKAPADHSGEHTYQVARTAPQLNRLEQQTHGGRPCPEVGLQHIGVAIVTSDPSGRVSFMNTAAEQLTGISFSEAAGQTIEQVLRVIKNDGSFERFANVHPANAADPPVYFSGTLLRPDKTKLDVTISTTAITETSGTMDGTVSVVHDISHLQRRQREISDTNELLERSNEKLMMLSHSLAHDLNGPLHAISLYSYLLSQEHPESLNENARNYLQEIEAACSRTAALMSSLMEFYSAAALDRRSAEWIDSKGPYQEALLNLRVAIQSSQARIEASNLPRVYIHPTALMLIFQNLLSNAIKYAGSRLPRIQISVSRDGEFWRFTVADEGLGFDPEHAERIFDLFKRANGSNRPGSGVGLAICRRLVGENGGKIWAESTPGSGARFHFTLPAPTCKN